MSNHNILHENKQSRLMDVVDRLDTRIDANPNLGKVAKKIGGGVLALGIIVGGGAIYNEVGPRTTIDTEIADVGSLDFSQARSVVLNKTEKLADKHGINLEDITGVTSTTSSLLHEHGGVELSKKPFAGYVVSPETGSSDPANIPSQIDQQDK